MEFQSAIYCGKVRHRRFAPKHHSFGYDVFMFYLDLDELTDLSQISRLFSTDKKRGFGRWFWRWRREDYFLNNTSNLKNEIYQWLADRGIKNLSGPIRMLANVRCFNFIINPIVCYFIFDKNNSVPKYVIAEVTNTPWHERTQYLLTCDESGNLKDFEFEKKLHVSPFHGMNMFYRWCSISPGDNVHINIENVVNNRGSENVIFDATINLRRIPFTAQNLQRTFFQFPIMTFKALFGIYWQALKIFVKKIPVQPHPKNLKARP